jgi:uncharacterized protein YjbI with pentapeptide repeats
MMENTNEIPDKAELERQQLYLSNEKLKIETEKLARESVPEKWWSKLAKNVVAIGGIVTVAATMYGLYDSYTKTIADRDRAREDRARTRTAEQRLQFEDAVKRLEAKGTVSKLVGVSVLSAYLNHDNKAFHHQILFTLASLVATEEDLQTQTAVADLVKAIPPATIDETDWLNFQDALASQSRALVMKGGLYRHRQFGLDGVVPSLEERTARFVSKLISINVQKGVVQGYRNYQGIYCENCDFRNATFTQNVNFAGAILDGANFRHATLPEASFDNADLGGATFVEAYLGKARFRSLDEKNLGEGSTEQGSNEMEATPYLNHIAKLLESRARVVLNMPDFSCANLDGARFDNHALFPLPLMAQRTFAKGDEKKAGWPQTVPEYLQNYASDKSPSKFTVAVVYVPKFYKASLQGARLENARYFKFSEKGSMKGLSSAVSETIAGFEIYQGNLSDDVLEIRPERPENDKAKPEIREESNPFEMTKDERRRFQQSLKATYYLANIDQATLPRGVVEFLKSSPPTEEDYRRQFFTFFGDDPNANCTPRAAQ